MILDNHLIFASVDDVDVTTSRAVCMTQNDLLPPTDGIGPYDGMWLNVTPVEDAASLAVTLQHCDLETGTWEDLVVYPAKPATAGERFLAVPLPHVCKNWLRLKFSSAFNGNAFLSIGVDKFN